jgi:hypothetical protein
VTRISSVDQVLVLLQEQLRRTGKRGPVAARRGVDRSGQATASPIDRARALAALETLSEQDVRGVMIHGVLAEAFGEQITNDARFQSIVADVTRIIAESPDGPALLDRAVTELRAGAL